MIPSEFSRRTFIIGGSAIGLSTALGVLSNSETKPTHSHLTPPVKKENTQEKGLTVEEFYREFDWIFEEGLKLPTSRKYDIHTRETRGDIIEGDVLFHEGEWTTVKIRRGMTSRHIQGLPQDNVANDGKPRSFRSIYISTFRKDNSRYPSPQFYSGSVIFILDDHKPRITKFELGGNDPKNAKIIEDRELTMEELKQTIKELRNDLEEEKFRIGVTDRKL